MGEGTKQPGCALCGVADHLTFHHLIPKRVHRKPWVRKRYSVEQLRHLGIRICRLCHDFIHRQFDEQTLARDFDSLARLLAHPAVQRHLAWAAKQRRIAVSIAR